MKKNFLIIFIVFSVFFIFTQKVSAQDSEKSLCGWAGIEGSDMCCISESNTDGLKIVESEEPNEGFLQRLKDAIFKNNPVYKGFSLLNDSVDTYGEITEEYKDSVRCNTGYEDNSSGSCICKLEENIHNFGFLPTKLDTNGNPIVDNKIYAQTMCKKYLNSNREPVEREYCLKCAEKQNYWSALGCIPTNISELITYILVQVGLSVGSMVALFCLVLNSLKIQLSKGNAEALTKARENITSCLLGLLLIIFSVFLLNLIGVSLGDIFLINGIGSI